MRRPPPAPAQPPPRWLLDVFEVTTTDTAEPDWAAFRDELVALMALQAGKHGEEALQQVIESLGDTSIGGDEQGALLPIRIEVDNESSPDATRLAIRSTDTPGFLFEFANALAMLDLSIERAQIRTEHGETRDTFWVTDAAGHRVEDERRLAELRVATALIKQFTHLLPRSPNPSQALRQFRALARSLIARPEWGGDLDKLRSEDVLGTLAELLGVSEFLWDDFLRMQHENLFPVVADVPALDVERSREEMQGALEAELVRAEDHAARVEVLHRFKDREMFRIDLRHITQRSDIDEFSAALTRLGEIIVEAAAGLAHEEIGEGGAPCPWAIMALGKFGGREMGFASDVELLFVYDDGSPRADNDPAAYFRTFVHRFTAIVAGRREGIFELDLRLRPYGDGGPLASSVDALRSYYSPEGDALQFERLALVKLRPVAGDTELGRAVEELRDAYVYSGEPLDLAEVRHLRDRQIEERTPPGAIHAKYGSGGAVDVEYAIQIRQIEAASTDEHPSLRVTNTLRAIEALSARGYLEPAHAKRIAEAYRFLRRLIDAMRAVRGNARDLVVPERGSAEFAYLARRLHYDSTEALTQEIAEQMTVARSLWNGEA
jgi:glutamate-ammonia-ligase adenylyltransferase